MRLGVAVFMMCATGCGTLIGGDEESVASLEVPLMASRAGGDLSDPAAFAAALSTILSGLQKLMNNAISYGDHVAHERLREAHQRIEALRASVDSSIKVAGGTANDVVDNGSDEVRAILSDLRRDTREIGTYSTMRINAWLGDVSGVVDIFVNVPPTVLSISPPVFEVNAAPSRLRISGYLPGKPNTDVTVEVGGKRASVTRSSGHTVLVSLEKALVRPGTEIPITVRARERWGPWDLFWTTHEFTEYVRVASSTCFRCSVRELRENPAYRSDVLSSLPYVIEATTQGGKNLESTKRSISVENLFRATMGVRAAEFDVSSAILISYGPPDFKSFGGCGSRNPGVTPVTMEGEGPQAVVSVTVTAPRTKNEQTTIGYYGKRPFRIPKKRVCKEGGTHGVLTWRPEFRVAKKTSPKSVTFRQDTLQFGYAGTSLPHLSDARNDWVYHVQCTYRDGSETWQMSHPAVVSPSNKSSSVMGITARVQDDRLYIAPTEPLGLVP